MNSIGLMLDNFLRISFWTDPVSKSGFPEAWTVFYWAWWLAYAFIGDCFLAASRRVVRSDRLFWGLSGLASWGRFFFLVSPVPAFSICNLTARWLRR